MIPANYILPVTPKDYDEEPAPNIVSLYWSHYLCRQVAEAQIRCQADHYTAIEISCCLYFGERDEETDQIRYTGFEHLENLHARVTNGSLSFHSNSKWSNGEFFTTDDDNPPEIVESIEAMKLSIVEEKPCEVYL